MDLNLILRCTFKQWLGHRRRGQMANLQTIYKPRREASEESRSDYTLILDFWLLEL